MNEPSATHELNRFWYVFAWLAFGFPDILLLNTVAVEFRPCQSPVPHTTTFHGMVLATIPATTSCTHIFHVFIIITFSTQMVLMVLRLAANRLEPECNTQGKIE